MRKNITMFCSCIFVFMIGIVPFLWASFYTIPGIDDLCVATDIRSMGDGYITRAINEAISLFCSWQGTYFTNILIGLIKPFDSFGTIGLRIYTFCAIILFVISIIMIIYILFRCFINSETMKLAILFGLVLLFIVLNVNRHVEFFYFNIVIHAYTAPFIFGGVALACVISCYLEKNYGTKYIIGIILGIFACGGVLQISAIMSYVSLLLAIKSYCNTKRVKNKESVFFVCMFVFSCINTFAPGNFNRADNSVFSLESFIKAIFNASYVTALELRHIVIETYFPFYAILFFLLLYYIGLEYNEKLRVKPLIILIHTILISVVATFPVVLGHNSTYMENRNTTILDFELIIGLLLSVYVFYNSLIKESNVKQLKNNAQIMMLIVVLGIICFNQNYDFTDQPSLDALHQLANGKVQQYSNDMDVVINYLGNSTGAVAVPPVHCEQGVIYRLDFDENSDYWINKGAAEYFGLNSIYMDIDLEVNDLREMGY